jgi:four helix bundle protein
VDKDELEKRTKTFSLKVIEFSALLARNMIGDVLGRQFLKAGTSIGANYREANRAESRKDFAHKIGIVQKEAAESQYWLELFHEADLKAAQLRSKKPVLNPASRALLSWLLPESTELLAIFTAIGRTLKKR